MTTTDEADSLAAILGRMTRVDGGWRAPLPGSWMQGRTCFGGLSAALLLAVARRDHDDLPPLRSALIGFTAPIGKPPLIRSRKLRQGRNVTTINAEARLGEQVVSTGDFAFGQARDSAIRVDCPAPEAPSPETTEPLIPAGAEAFAPGFHRNFDMRLIEGDRPFSGSARGYMRGWVRHRNPASRTGIESLMCLADILPPAVMPMFPRLGTNSSVTWICNFLDADPQTDDGWWQAETRLTAARDGYSSQVMRMWDTEGRLVIEGMQSVLIFV